MSDKNEKAAETILGCVGLVVLLPVAVLVGGSVLQHLWAWFIVPTFGLKALTLAQAIGLDLVGSVLQTQPYRPKKDGETMLELLGVTVGRVLVWPAYLLLVGLIVRGFLP